MWKTPAAGHTAGERHLTQRSTWQHAVIVLSWSLVLTAVFLQIERGTGNRMLILLFVLFDLLLVLALASSLLSLTRRWRFAMLAAPALVLLVYLASWLRMRYTAMAAQAHDLADLVSGWNLVAPFAMPGIVSALAGFAILGVLAKFEKPLQPRLRTRCLMAGLAGALFVICAQIDDHLPEDDSGLASAGPGPKIALFFRSIYRPPALEPAAFDGVFASCCIGGTDEPPTTYRGTVKPNLVVVLQESTFSPVILRGHKEAKGFLFNGAAPLRVHVQGGGTWVEEFSILHGIPATAYGRDYLQIQRLGPARGLQGRLAPFLSRQGYTTTTVYPTANRMLSAERLHHSLGIENFRGCGEIKGCVDGPNWNETKDSVLFDEVLKVLADEQQPHFVFTATMRQHSPHVSQFPLKRYQAEIMQEYGRRLAMSHTEANQFVSALRQLKRPTIVLMFGDHIPSDVVGGFDSRDFVGNPYQTFFNLYDAAGIPRAAELMKRYPGVAAPDSAFLDVLLLEFAGFGGDYIDTKLDLMRRCGGSFCGAVTPSELQAEAGGLPSPPAWPVR